VRHRGFAACGFLLASTVVRAHDFRPLLVDVAAEAPRAFRVSLRVPPSVATANAPDSISHADCQSAALPTIGQPVRVLRLRRLRGLVGRSVRIIYPADNPSPVAVPRCAPGDGREPRVAVLPPEQVESVLPAPRRLSIRFLARERALGCNEQPGVSGPCGCRPTSDCRRAWALWLRWRQRACRGARWSRCAPPSTWVWKKGGEERRRPALAGCRNTLASRQRDETPDPHQRAERCGGLRDGFPCGALVAGARWPLHRNRPNPDPAPVGCGSAMR